MSDADHTSAYLAKARPTLAIEDACNRAYDAMFDAAQAALYTEGFGERTAAIKTHSGLLSFFG